MNDYCNPTPLKTIPLCATCFETFIFTENTNKYIFIIERNIMNCSNNLIISDTLITFSLQNITQFVQVRWTLIKFQKYTKK